MKNYLYFPLSVLLLAGCGSYGLQTIIPDDELLDESEDDDQATDTNPGATDTQDSNSPETQPSGDGGIDAIFPNYGSTAGGTAVEITGGPFDGSTTVSFAGEEATILSNAGTLLRVQTPSISSEGDVEVQVTDGSGTRTAGFTYYQDGTGLAGAFGYLSYATLTGSYWSETYETGAAMAIFLVPQDIHWWELYAPSMDSCAASSSHSYSGDIYLQDMGESTLYMERSGTGSPFPLNLDSSNNTFISGELNSSVLFSNAAYDLVDFTGKHPGFSVPQFGRTSQAPMVTSPPISGTSPPYLYQNTSFNWAPSGASWISIRMSIPNSTNDAYVADVYCIAQDDGSFTVDTSSLSPYWSSGGFIYVQFTRAYENNTILPHNNSQARMVGEYTLLGGGFMN